MKRARISRHPEGQISRWTYKDCINQEQLRSCSADSRTDQENHGATPEHCASRDTVAQDQGGLCRIVPHQLISVQGEKNLNSYHT